MAVYDFSSGLGLLGQGIDSLGASLKDSFKTRSSQQLATALANGDYAGAMQAAAAAGDTDSVMKIRTLQQQASEGAAMGDIYKRFQSLNPDGSMATPGMGAATGANPAGYDSGAVEGKIRAKAQELGIDPNIAARVFGSEGKSGYYGDKDAAGNYTSFGPLQLHYRTGGGGMGNVSGMGDQFTAATGKNARDPSTIDDQIDFALRQAKQHGWGQWYGAAKVGISPWQGIGATTAGSEAAAPVAVAGGNRPQVESDGYLQPPATAAAGALPPMPPMVSGVTGGPAASSVAPVSQADVPTPGAAPASGASPQLVNAPLPPVRPPGDLGGALAAPDPAVAQFLASHVGPVAAAKLLQAPPGTPVGQLVPPGAVPPDDMAKTAGQLIAEAKAALAGGMAHGAPPGLGATLAPPAGPPSSIPPPAPMDASAGAPTVRPPGAGLPPVPGFGDGTPAPAPAAALAPAVAPPAPAPAPAPPVAATAPPTPAPAPAAISVPGYRGTFTRAQAEAAKEGDDATPGTDEWDAAAAAQGAGVPSGPDAAGAAGSTDAPPAPVTAKLPPTPAAAKAGDPTAAAAAPTSPAVAQSLARTRPGSDERMMLLALMARAAAGSANPTGNLKFVEMLAGIEKSHQEQFEKQKTPVTPAELAQLGIKPAPGVGYQKDAFGNITTVQGAKPQEQILTADEVKAAGLTAAAGPGRVFARDADGKITTIDAPKDVTSYTPLITPEERRAHGIPDNDKRPYQLDNQNKVSAVGGQGQTINIGESEAQKKAIDSLDKGSEAARQGAIPALVAANRMQQYLDKGIVSGYGKLQPAAMGMAEIFAKMGLGDLTKVGNTQQYMQSAMNEWIPLAKAYFPQRVTNADLNMTELMSGTNPANTKVALQLAIDVAKERAKRIIDQHNLKIQRYKEAFPDQAGVADMYRVDPDEIPTDVKPAAGGAPKAFDLNEERSGPGGVKIKRVE